MFPTYLSSKPFGLARDDISAIRLLFGPSKRLADKKPTVEVPRVENTQRKEEVERPKTVEPASEERKVTPVEGIKNHNNAERAQPVAEDRGGRKNKHKRKVKKQRKSKEVIQENNAGNEQGGILGLINDIVNRIPVVRETNRAGSDAGKSGSRKVAVEGRENVNVETIIRRVSGSESSQVIVNGKVVYGKQKDEILNKMSTLDGQNELQPAEEKESEEQETTTSAVTEATTSSVSVKTTTASDDVTASSSTSADDVTKPTTTTAASQSSVRTADIPQGNRTPSASDKNKSPNTNTREIEHVKDATVPTGAPLMVKGISLVQLKGHAELLDWNGELAWFPSEFSFNKQLVLGVQNGLKLVDVSSMSPFSFFTGKLFTFTLVHNREH